MTKDLVKRSSGTSTPAARYDDLFSALRSEMDRLFDDFFNVGFPRMSDFPRLRSLAGDGTLMPRIDVRETSNALIVDAELPGMDDKDIDVTMHDGMLTIRGEKKSEHSEKGEDYHVMERRYGSFRRSVRLPESINEDKVEAKFEKGVLTITLPKRPEAIKGEKKIAIKSR